MSDPRAFWKDEHGHMYYSPYHKKLLEFHSISVSKHADFSVKCLFLEEIRQLDEAFWAD